MLAAMCAQADAAAPDATEEGQKHTPATPASGKPHSQATNTKSPLAGQSESRPSTGVAPSSPIAAPSNDAAPTIEGTSTKAPTTTAGPHATGPPTSTPNAPSTSAAVGARAPAVNKALIFTSKPQIVPAAPPTAGHSKEVIPMKQQQEQQSSNGEVEAIIPVEQQQQSLAAPAPVQVVNPVGPAGSTAHLTVNTHLNKVSATQSVRDWLTKAKLAVGCTAAACMFVTFTDWRCCDAGLYSLSGGAMMLAIGRLHVALSLWTLWDEDRMAVSC